MKYLNFKSEYDPNPINNVHGYDNQIFENEEIISELSKIRNGVIAFEVYPGVDLGNLYKKILSRLNTDCIINIEDYAKDEKSLNKMFQQFLTDDRVFGIMSHFTIDQLYDEKLNSVTEIIKKHSGIKIIYGFGASQIAYDYLVYVDITRWELQTRFRNGMANFKINNSKEDTLKKYKRGYFIEWRIADRIKKSVYSNIDYIIDGSTLNKYTMITKEAYDGALDLLITKPFRLVPYFDPGVWGGQWMKEVCNLDKSAENYAWSFDGVPEENSLKFSFASKVIELPAINLVFFRAEKLLGRRVFGRFGTEYPIRFDFLDTMEGGNLSLQVHPLTEYIQDKFGMHYTQDESYYILDAAEEANVYLGVKAGIDQKQMIEDLEKANLGEIVFDDRKYINQFPVKKHDHISIPSGTIHCSGKNTMVLEISSTPYIFTFKLWDWERIGLDGRPRPIHINHGKEVIQFNRDTMWVKEELINNFEKISEYEEKTGLHELEFIETRRLKFSDKIHTTTEGSVNTLNLVEGIAVIVESPFNQFEPYVVHYAETFIIPENVKEYTLRPRDENMLCMVIKAFVR